MTLEDTLTHASKLFSPSGLEVEFLIAQRGSGEQAVLPTALGVNAQALTNLGMLADHPVAMDVLGMRVHAPRPEAYVLHKGIINARRSTKGEKDRQAILSLLPHLHGPMLRQVFASLTRKQQAAALQTLEALGAAAYKTIESLGTP